METKEQEKKTGLFTTIYSFFFADHFFKKEQVNKKIVYHSMQTEELKTCTLAAFIALLVEIVFLINDFINTSKTFDKVYFYYIPEITIIVYSVILIICAKKISMTRKFVAMRVLCSLFYLLVVLGTAMCVYANILEEPNSFSFSIFFLMVMVIAPCTHLIDTIIVFILSAAGITSALLIANPATLLYPYFIILLLLVFFSIYFRGNLVKSTIYRVKEHDLHEVLKFQTYTDTLTCALNRRAFEEVLSDNFDNWRNTKENVVLIMFDIDNFKEYNDNFSHLTGDEVLKLVASTASQLCNKNMPNIFRYGGDEFLMIVVGCDRLDVLTKSMDLLHSAANLKINRSKNQELYLTISVGVTMLNNKIDSPAEFISMVDEDLYFAKNNGKACVAFEKKIYR